MADPFDFNRPIIRDTIRSFSTEDPIHPLLRSFITGQDAQEQVFHSLGSTIRGQDVGPMLDCLLGRNVLMGCLNSRTGFCSQRNNFCVLAPVVIFNGKQTFSCQMKYYPTYTAGPLTVRSDAATLPAESETHSTSAEMFGLKIVLEPETNLICNPKARLQEYMNRKEQIENSLNQSMQEQICHALANCPSMTMMRLREDAPSIKMLCSMPETLYDFVYNQIQVASNEFCQWTLNCVEPGAALQDAFNSIASDSRRGQEPTCVVTTPEVADYIANYDSVKTKSEAMYTVHFDKDEGVFVPGQVRPYEGVSKQITVETSGVKVNGKILPVLQVPHLSRESNSTYNTFEHEESFWVFNEIGYNSGLKNTKVSDFSSVSRTEIEVTDLHKGRDGRFSMQECLLKGGGLLPQTYDRFRYDEMFRTMPGLKTFLDKQTNPTELLSLIGRPLPMSSPYCLYFPSPKVRYQRREGPGCNFRSAGIFGNRPSFENWHPPCGDLEAAKDWMAKKIKLKDTDLDEFYEYISACAELAWTAEDLIAMVDLDQEFPRLNQLAEAPLTADGVKYLLEDLSRNKGFCKFIGIPRYFFAIASLASRCLQDRPAGDKPDKSKDGKDQGKGSKEKKLDVNLDYLMPILKARATLDKVSNTLCGLFNRVDAPDGVLTDAPSSVPMCDFVYRAADLNMHVTQISQADKAALRFYGKCIVPLVFRKLHNLVLGDEEKVQYVTYRIPNPTERHAYRNEEETFQQPYFARVIPTNKEVSSFAKAVQNFKLLRNTQDAELVDVTAYDPLFDFDIDVLRLNQHSREGNFFDHFLAHRYDYLRKTSDEPFMVRVTAAYLCMTKYTPPIEAAIGHTCLMNRKYRIVRQCSINVGMVGVYAGGIENMMYGVGNMSTVVTPTANNSIEITTRVAGNCFIMDPLSSGRVIQNAVSKQLRSGMTSTMINIPAHLGDSRSFSLPNEWWRNAAFVLEGLPGTHPLKDQHHFVPLNGRHVPENYNSSGFDITKKDVVTGYFTENPYATRGYSEGHLIYGELFPTNQLPLYDGNPAADGIQTIHQRANVQRKEMSGQVVELQKPLQSCFSGRSNIGFLERQTMESTQIHGQGAVCSSDSWFSKSPLKQNSNSGNDFTEALRLNCKHNDTGIRNVIDGRLQKTGVKGRYATKYI